MGEVVSIGQSWETSERITPEMLLIEILTNIRAGRETSPKCVVIMLDNDEDKFDTRYINAGMRTNEIMAVCEITKQKMLKQMGYA